MAGQAGFAGAVATDPQAALAAISAGLDGGGGTPIVLIAGSLYLAGRVLEANGTIPD
jgi:dihydrofolate synthase/folylpolyglutamate synthase